MTEQDLFEREFADRLKQCGGTVPGTDGWPAIHSRIGRRNRTRTVRRSLVTVTTIAMVTAGLASLVRLGNDDVRQVQPAGNVPTKRAAPTQTFPTQTLPRLVLTLPGYQATHAFDSEKSQTFETFAPPESVVATGPDEVTTGPVQPVKPGDDLLAVVSEPGRGYQGRLLFVRTMSSSLSGGLSAPEQAQPNARPVKIGDRNGHLVTPDMPGMPTLFLRWNLANGRGVTITSYRMSLDEMLTAARSMAVASDQSVSWAAGALPSGLSLLRSGSVVDGTGSGRSSNVTYERDGNVLSLDIQEGGPLLLDEIMSGHAGSAVSIDQVEVSGVPAALVRFPGGAGGTLAWQVRPGFVAQMTGGFVTDVAAGEASGLQAKPAGSDAAFADLVPAARSLREISEPEWDALLGRFGSDLAGIDAIGLVREMCDARGNWLKAYENTAADEEGQALNRLTRLFEIAARTDASKDSDVAMQLKRLVDAAAIRDAAAVRSIPEGGGCQPAP